MNEPPRAKWSDRTDAGAWIVAGVFVSASFFLAFDGQDMKAQLMFMLAFLTIGVAALLRVVARPKPWRGMRMQLLAMNIVAGVAALAAVTYAIILLGGR